VAVELADPGNLGTLVRVAEAAGAVGVVATAGSVDLHAPKVVRAAAGSSFRVPLCADVDPQELLEVASRLGLPVVGSVVAGGAAPERVGLDGGFLLLVGSEAHGLAPALVDACTTRVSVPMGGRVESLNAAVAAAVVLFEGARQRRASSGAGTEGHEAAQRSGGRTSALGHDVGPDRAPGLGVRTEPSERQP
jgi:TrmH family RNA methyltransferase